MPRAQAKEQKISPLYAKLCKKRMGVNPAYEEDAINALEQLVLRFPLEGWAIDGKTCKCLQYEDHGQCRHLVALAAVSAVRISR